MNPSCTLRFLRYNEILVEDRRLNLPNLFLAPPLGVTPLQFRLDFWRQKTGVSELSYGAICVTLHLAVLVQCRLVTDGRTDGHTTTVHTALAYRRAVKTFK